MRTLTTMLAMLLLTAAAGCQPARPAADEGFTVGAVNQGLLLGVNLPGRYFARGDTVPLTLLARNVTDRDMVIHADSGALVYVRLARHTSMAWQEVKRFPAAAVTVARDWKLPAGGSHKFVMNLDVTPDWPTGEPLRLTAELNGRDDVQPAALIEVFATPEECDRRKAY
jgi:hypothetical protein